MAKSPVRILPAERLIKGPIARCGVSVSANIGTVEIKRRSRWQQPPRPAHQPFRCFPRADVNHIDEYDGEIGRESCRKRVCQYVYISVVACTLKKNEMLHENTSNETT